MTKLADQIVHAAYTCWRNNGHDVYGALLHIHHNHEDPAIRHEAGVAYDDALRVPVVRAELEREFAHRAELERIATTPLAVFRT